MKRLLAVLCTLPLFSLSFVACSDSETETDRAATIEALAGDTMNGQVRFEASCGLGSSCHNADGTSGNGNATDLTTSGGSYTNAFIISVMLDGTGDMPAQSTLDDQVIADISAYVLQEWGP